MKSSPSIINDSECIRIRARMTKDGGFRNPMKEVFPAGYPIGEGDLETFEKKKDVIVSIMSDSAPYWKRLENTTGEALEKS